MVGFRIGDITAGQSGGVHRVSARVDHPAGCDTVWFESSEPFGCQPADAFVALAASCALSAGGPIVCREPVSHRLAEGLWRIGRLNQASDPDAPEIQIDAPRRIGAENTPPGPIRAALFTAGVDSYHTAMDPSLRTDALFAVLGGDIAVDNRTQADSLLPRWRRAADELGKRLIVVRTNARELIDRFARWESIYTIGLAAAGHLFQGRIGVLYASASMAWRDMSWPPQDPVVVPLLGSESLWLGFHGAEHSRQAKIRAVAGLPLVQQTLQVCIDNPTNPGNCSRCEKCVRTMLGLMAEGRLGEFSTFGPMPEPAYVRALRFHMDRELSFMRELETVLRSRPDCRPWADALRHAVRRCEGRTFSRRWRRWILGERAGGSTRRSPDGRALPPHV
ncbi:MAG: hypothetical protein JNJ48_04815 [Phycisphaerae bacterium]|nr:hypothetical protein [Phycisphaerae bacterium]